jgi:hypothetical protein
VSAARTLLPVLGVPIQSKALNGMDSHLPAEPGHVVGAGEDAAREVFLPQVAGGDQQLLGGLLHRLHVVVLVDDRLADDQDLQILSFRPFRRPITSSAECR